MTMTIYNKRSLFFSISRFTQQRGRRKKRKESEGWVTNAACPPIVVHGSFVFLSWSGSHGLACLCMTFLCNKLPMDIEIDAWERMVQNEHTWVGYRRCSLVGCWGQGV